MHRQPLLNLLRQHLSASRTSDSRLCPNASEQAMTQATIAFVEQHPACFDRLLPTGERTAPADRAILPVQPGLLGATRPGVTLSMRTGRPSCSFITANSTAGFSPVVTLMATPT